MANYMKQPEVPVKQVWIVNPVGRVVEVPETAPEAEKAIAYDQGWKPASADQIKDAKAAAKERDRVGLTKQNAVNDAAAHAAAMIGAAKQVKKAAEKAKPETE